MDLRLPKQDSATGRGIKTGAQATIGALIVFGTGLIGVVNAVPGCGPAVVGFLQDNALQYALLLGIPSGVVGLVWNLFRPKVPNY